MCDDSRNGYKAYVQQIPSPYLTIFVSADHTSLSLTETSAATIGLVDVTGKVVEHLPCRRVH